MKKNPRKEGLKFGTFLLAVSGHALLRSPIMRDKTETIDPGLVVWITGLAGAGKSTVAGRVVGQLRAEGHSVVLLDGDVIRDICANDLGHSYEDRVKNAYRISRFCKTLSEQGFHVVCGTMSLFPEIWSFNREQFRKYLQVYLKVANDELHQRDQKGLYSGAPRSQCADVVGVDIDFLEPLDSDLVLDNSRLDDLEINVSRIVKRASPLLAP